jgi:hypothetical protein
MMLTVYILTVFTNYWSSLKIRFVITVKIEVTLVWIMSSRRFIIIAQ